MPESFEKLVRKITLKLIVFPNASCYNDIAISKVIVPFQDKNKLVVLNIWLESSALNMSDSRFQGLARAYLADMICAQNPLHKLQSLFCAGKDVQCYHCDFVISTLASFTQAVRSFDLLLRQMASSPVSLSMKYSTLALTVDQLDDQEYQIKSLINAYRPYCQLYSKQVLKQKHEIQHMLKKFVQRTDTFLQQVAHFIEETHVPEKKPVLVYPHYESHAVSMQHKEGVTILLYHHFTLPPVSDYVP